MEPDKDEAGVSVYVWLPFDGAGVALVIGTQVEKLLEETCTDPAQAVDVPVVIVAGSAARLKVRAIVLFSATDVAPLAGVVLDTLSAKFVVNPLMLVNADASAAPSLSCAAVVTRILYVAEPARAADGVSVYV